MGPCFRRDDTEQEERLVLLADPRFPEYPQ
jgi:hypothetical protein